MYVYVYLCMFACLYVSSAVHGGLSIPLSGKQRACSRQVLLHSAAGPLPAFQPSSLVWLLPTLFVVMIVKICRYHNYHRALKKVVCYIALFVCLFLSFFLCFSFSPPASIFTASPLEVCTLERMHTCLPRPMDERRRKRSLRPHSTTLGASLLILTTLVPGSSPAPSKSWPSLISPPSNS